MPKRSEIHRSFNIPESIIAEAERQGLDAMATGGGVDYIYKKLGTNQDGSERVVLLATAHDAGTPDRLSERSELQVMMRQDWTDAVTIPVPNAKEGMALMAKMYDPYVQ